MAVFTSSAFALRRKRIVSALERCGARTPETAKTLAEAGVEQPDLFEEYTEKLVLYEVLCKTPDGKYYLGNGG